MDAKMEQLILVTGPTGSGKSTTLAAMIEHVNQNSDRHIITIELELLFFVLYQYTLFFASITHKNSRILKETAVTGIIKISESKPVVK